MNVGQILGSTGWLTAERVLRMSLGLLVSVWLARYLGPEGFGTFNYVLATVLLFSEVATLGLNAILVRDLVEVRDTAEETTVLGTAVVLRFVGGAMALLLSTGLVVLLRGNGENTAVLVAIFAIGFAFRASDVIDFYFQARTRARSVVLARGSAYAITTVAVMIGILIGAPLILFIALRATEFVLTTAGFLMVYTASEGPPPSTWRFSGKAARAMLSKSWPLILSGVGAVVYLKIDQLMLGEMIGDSAVGVYAVAAQLSEVWYFLPQAFCIAVFPSLLDARERDPALYATRLQWLLDVLAMAALAISVPVALLAGPVVDVLYGDAFSGAGAVLSIHIWASIFIFMRAALSKWFVAEDLYLFSLVTHGAGALVNVAANLWLIPRYGPIGAALGTVVSYAAASYLSLFFHRRTWPMAARMSLALVAPIRWLARTIVRARTG